MLKYLSKKDLQQIIRVSDACNKTREMLLENYSVPKVVMPENCSVSYVNVAGLPRFDADNIHKIKLKKLLGDLSKDQRRALIAIMWIGRGDFAPDFSRAFEATKVISNQGDIQYLLGKGAIGFYLSIGLERLGIRLDSTEMPHPGKVDQQ